MIGQIVQGAVPGRESAAFTAVVGHVEPGSSGGGLGEVQTGLGDPVLRGRLRRRGLPWEGKASPPPFPKPGVFAVPFPPEPGPPAAP